MLIIKTFTQKSNDILLKYIIRNSSNGLISKFKGRVDDNYVIIKETVIGQMAKRMSKEDAKALANYWGYTELINQSNSDKNLYKLPAIETYQSTNTINKKINESESSESYKNTTLFHPVLGELLMDLGYKKLYLSCVKALGLAPVWEKQRILRPERANLIASDKIKYGFGSKLSGSIVMYMNKHEFQDYGIIDGQHRVGALLILAQKGLRISERFLKNK
jgi:hypothetical protein